MFLRRTEKEIEIFGGDVYFDVDGRNGGKLSLINQIIELSAGEYTLKMYKSHKYDTDIGFAESIISLTDQEVLMVKYSCLMTVSQPGNMVISEYSELNGVEAVRSRDAIIERDFIAQGAQKKGAAEKYRTGIWIMIVIAVVIGIIYGVVMSPIM